MCCISEFIQRVAQCWQFTICIEHTLVVVLAGLCRHYAMSHDVIGPSKPCTLRHLDVIAQSIVMRICTNERILSKLIEWLVSDT